MIIKSILRIIVIRKNERTTRVCTTIISKSMMRLENFDANGIVLLKYYINIEFKHCY